MDFYNGTLPPEESPYQRLAEDPQHKLHLSLAFTQSIFVFCTVFLSVLLLTMITLRGRIFYNVFNLLLSNLAMGSVIFSLLIRPGTIREEITTSPLSPTYCGFYLTFIDLEAIFLPFVLLILTTERRIALIEPESYNLRFPSLVKVILLALPWVWGFTFGIVRNFALADGIIAHYGPYPDDAYYNSHTKLSAVGCMLIFFKGNDHGYSSLGNIFISSVPIIFLTFASVILLVAYCKKRRELNEQTAFNPARPIVQSSSIFFCLILNLAMVITLATDSIITTFIASWANPHWKTTALELLVAVLGLTCLVDIRKTIASTCCWEEREEDEDQLLSQSEPDSQGPSV